MVFASYTFTIAGLLTRICPAKAPLSPEGVADKLGVDLSVGDSAGVAKWPDVGVIVGVSDSASDGVAVGVAVDVDSHIKVVMIWSKTADSAALSNSGGGVT